MDGIINLYKPAGMTSFQCVAAVKKILKTKKVGHAGTLDPEATGVLPICVGKATKLAELFLCCPKSYRGKVLFGLATDTQDVWGQTLEEADASGLTLEEVQKAAGRFHGEIEQTPSAFSAIKINGQPLYKKARAGVDVDVPSRKVTVYSFNVGTDLDVVSPDKKETVVETTCSRGTYVRTLCYDLGKAVGLPACMSELCRTSYGPMKIEDSVTLEQLETEQESCLLPLDFILHNFTKIEFTDIQLKRFITGLPTTVAKNQLKMVSEDFLYPAAEADKACVLYRGKLIAVVSMGTVSMGTDLGLDQERVSVKSWKFFGGPEVNAGN